MDCLITFVLSNYNIFITNKRKLKVISLSAGLFFNFEKLSTQIIESELNKMNDDNLTDFPSLHIEKLQDNLYHGSIVATFIVNLYESTLNTIVNRMLGIKEPDVLKTSHNIKLQLICTMYHVDLSSIKSDNNFALLQSIIKLRNDITHYKSFEMYCSACIPPDIKSPNITSKVPIATTFTKTYMKKCYEATLAVIDLICEKCGLVCNKDCNIIDNDLRDYICGFVVSKEDYDRIKNN